MRPMSEILEHAWPYLTPASNPLDADREAFICYALARAAEAGGITGAEESAASNLILDAVRKLDPDGISAYLYSAAVNAGLLKYERGMIDTKEYIEFRDNWLRNLIERLRYAELRYHRADSAR